MQWFNQLKISVKLMSGFAVVVLVSALGSGVGFIKMQHVSRDARAMYEQMTSPLGDLGVIAVSFQQNWIDLRDAVMASGTDEIQKPINNVMKTRQQIMDHIDRVEQALVSDEDRRIFSELIATRQTYPKLIDQVIAHAKNGEVSEASDIIHGDAFSAAMLRQNLILQLIQSKVKQSEAIAAHNQKEASAAMMLMASTILFSILFAIIISLLVARKITSALSEAIQTASRLSEGDLSIHQTANITSAANDEIGQLQVAMNTMVKSLRNLVSDTVKIASDVATASQQLSYTATQIADSTENAAGQTNNVATASEEIAATSNDIAHSCHAAAQSASIAANTTQSGFDVVKSTVDGIRCRGEESRKNADILSSLGQRSDQIGDIVATIEEIADQTNLLALNAAIEAARAGEQGRGFAVVADEVRALAERTTRATHEISGMIGAIQHETRSAIVSMEKGVEATLKGAAEAGQLEVSLQQVLDQVNDVTMQINQIATAAEEQTAATSDINSNMGQVTQAVQQTASGADETARAAAQLDAQAKELQNLVSRFRL